MMRLRLRLRRRHLDRELLAGSDPNRDPLILGRAMQLTDRSARAELARLFQKVLDVSSDPEARLHGAITIQRGSVRVAAPDIEELIDLLRGPQPISPQGVLMAYRLLTDGSGPLYRDYGDERRLVFAARRVGDGLRYGSSWGPEASGSRPRSHHSIGNSL
jgi:hypothetical protein